MGALGGPLASIGIAPDAVVKYETAIRAGQFAVIAHGTADDTRAAKRVLQKAAAQELDEHLPTPLPA